MRSARPERSFSISIFSKKRRRADGGDYKIAAAIGPCHFTARGMGGRDRGTRRRRNNRYKKEKTEEEEEEQQQQQRRGTRRREEEERANSKKKEDSKNVGKNVDCRNHKKRRGNSRGEKRGTKGHARGNILERKRIWGSGDVMRMERNARTKKKKKKETKKR